MPPGQSTTAPCLPSQSTMQTRGKSYQKPGMIVKIEALLKIIVVSEGGNFF